jgi:hypothetical protein
MIVEYNRTMRCESLVLVVNDESANVEVMNSTEASIEKSENC